MSPLQLIFLRKHFILFSTIVINDMFFLFIVISQGPIKVPTFYLVSLYVNYYSNYDYYEYYFNF